MTPKQRNILIKTTLATVANSKRVFSTLTKHRYFISVAIVLFTIVLFSRAVKSAPTQSISVQSDVAFTLTDLGGAEMLDVADNGQFAVIVGADTVTLVAIKEFN